MSLQIWCGVQRYLCREVVGHVNVKIISNLLFLFRKTGLLVKGWRPRWLMNILLTRPTSFLSEVKAFPNLPDHRHCADQQGTICLRSAWDLPAPVRSADSADLRLEQINTCNLSSSTQVAATDELGKNELHSLDY